MNNQKSGNTTEPQRRGERYFWATLYIGTFHTANNTDRRAKKTKMGTGHCFCIIPPFIRPLSQNHSYRDNQSGMSDSVCLCACAEECNFCQYMRQLLPVRSQINVETFISRISSYSKFKSPKKKLSIARRTEILIVQKARIIHYPQRFLSLYSGLSGEIPPPKQLGLMYREGQKQCNMIFVYPIKFTSL